MIFVWAFPCVDGDRGPMFSVFSMDANLGNQSSALPWTATSTIFRVPSWKRSQTRPSTRVKPRPDYLWYAFDAFACVLRAIYFLGFYFPGFFSQSSLSGPMRFPYPADTTDR